MQGQKRLFIESIEVENFKSYRGVHTIGPFGKGFNSVVGPNGAGKSNVIDSVLFVLGFKAKRLRHARAEDLINSSEPRPAKCTVSIIFITQDKKKFTVSRTVAAKGKSTYSIDGNSATSENIAELLKEHNVDLVNNRFMILQGEIENISNMKPKGTADSPGLVEYLEEIIGTHRYIEGIEEKEKALQSSAERADKSRAECAFAEKEVEYLRPKAEAAEADIVQYIDTLARRLAATEAELHAIEPEIEEKQVKLSVLSQEAERAAEDTAELLNSAKRKEDALEAKKNTLRTQEVAYLDAKRIYEQKDLQFIRNTDLLKIYTNKCEQLKEAQKQHAQLREAHLRQKNAYTEEMEENRTRIEASSKEKTEIEKKLSALETSVPQGLSEERKKAEEALLIHMTSTKKKKDTLRNNRRRAEELTKSRTKSEEVQKEIPREIEEIRERAQKYSEEALEKCRRKAEEVKKGREETLLECTKREALLKDLEKEQSTHNSSDTLAKHLGIEGYFGRVRDLGSVSEKYSVALSAAAKGSLNNLVVDTTRTAEKCLDIIKQKNLGRYTIIVLDKIKGPKGSVEEHRLVDKIKTEKKFLPCFYHVIGDTLVTDTMEAAMKRAFSPDRPKVVTLDGKVIDKSGLMSGGRVPHISLAHKRTPKDISKDIAQAQEAAKEAREGLAIMDQLREKAEAKLEACLKLKSEAETAPGRIAHLEGVLKAAQKEAASQSKGKEELSALRKEITAQEAELEQIQREEAELDRKKQKTEQSIEKRLGEQYRAQKARLQGLNEELVALQERNAHLAKKLAEEPPAPEDHEEKIREAEKKIAGISVHPPREEEEKLAQEERRLRDAKIAGEQAAEERNTAQAAVRALREQEIAHERKKTETEELLKRHTERAEALKKEITSVKGKEHVITTQLGKHAETLKEAAKSTQQKRHAQDTELPSTDTLLEVFLAYQEKKEQHRREEKTRADKEKEETHTKEELRKLKEKRITEFHTGIKKINTDLKRIYNTLTFGGDAELEAVDYLDPFSEGMVMSVMPPRKSWKSIAHLSGGERTLSSLSLIFALHEYHPNSFYVMDEVDAALDHKNVGIVGRYIEEKAKECQFIVISLRENMYELASVFIGVYKHADTTLSVAMQA